MLYEVFSVLHQLVDSGLNLVDSRFSFFLRALYPKEPLLALVEFLQARFKNIKIVPPLLTENIQLHARLVRYRAPHERLQQLTSEFALVAHLRLLIVRVRLAPSCLIRHCVLP
ncbi:hypothetical protein B296_00053420 [Ensete ventricosum]|uniref:Uncharacterized protein n=1 Tax=Ensete ventricosum TaxID=4639 RepID=A0A426XD42_ENSVE|nr:hypothetical protein B296_00053420 [Ensete ventricosum]